MNDDSPMPWGEHKGKRLGDVPAPYLMNLLQQTWLREYRDLHAWLAANRSEIEKSAAATEALRGSVDTTEEPIATFEDYLKTYRGF